MGEGWRVSVDMGRSCVRSELRAARQDPKYSTPYKRSPPTDQVNFGKGYTGAAYAFGLGRYVGKGAPVPRAAGPPLQLSTM